VAAAPPFADRRRSAADVGRRLQAILERDRALVTVSADEHASHGRVIQVVDLIRQAGIFRLDIETFSGATGSGSP
jgi:biopolymer transport protein ExbD